MASRLSLPTPSSRPAGASRHRVPRHRLVIFCDGGFWHGRNLEHRTAKLTRGHNAAFWTAKVKRNVERARQNTVALSAAGWNVLRLWETEILRETTKVADRIEARLCTTRSTLIGGPRAALRSIAVGADGEASRGNWGTRVADPRSGSDCRSCIEYGVTLARRRRWQARRPCPSPIENVAAR